jgi:hypothetical protein
MWEANVGKGQNFGLTTPKPNCLSKKLACCCQKVWTAIFEFRHPAAKWSIPAFSLLSWWPRSGPMAARHPCPNQHPYSFSDLRVELIELDWHRTYVLASCLRGLLVESSLHEGDFTSTSGRSAPPLPRPRENACVGSEALPPLFASAPPPQVGFFFAVFCFGRRVFVRRPT